MQKDALPVEEELPESQQPFQIEENRNSIFEMLSRMNGEEYEKGLEWLRGVTPEENKNLLKNIDEEDMTKMVAIAPLSVSALRQLLAQPHPMGFHSKGELLFTLRKLYELTGIARYHNLVEENQVPLSTH